MTPDDSDDSSVSDESQAHKARLLVYPGQGLMPEVWMTRIGHMTHRNPGCRTGW
jgi:hypothetical protein